MTQEMWFSAAVMVLTMLFNYLYTKNNPAYKKVVTVWNLVAALITQAINGVVTTTAAVHPDVAPTSAVMLTAVTATVSLGSSFGAQVLSFVVNTAIQTALTTGFHSWPKNFIEGVKNGFRSTGK